MLFGKLFVLKIFKIITTIVIYLFTYEYLLYVYHELSEAILGGFRRDISWGIGIYSFFCFYIVLTLIYHIMALFLKQRSKKILLIGLQIGLVVFLINSIRWNPYKTICIVVPAIFLSLYIPFRLVRISTKLRHLDSLEITEWLHDYTKV